MQNINKLQEHKRLTRPFLSKRGGRLGMGVLVTGLQLSGVYWPHIQLPHAAGAAREKMPHEAAARRVQLARWR